jgi:hypothetical protein
MALMCARATLTGAQGSSLADVDWSASVLACNEREARNHYIANATYATGTVALQSFRSSHCAPVIALQSLRSSQRAPANALLSDKSMREVVSNSLRKLNSPAAVPDNNNFLEPSLLNMRQSAFLR